MTLNFLVKNSENEILGFLIRIKGYRGIRKNSILRYNYIYSIYHKGKVREKRINRDFKTVVKDIMIYESL